MRWDNRVMVDANTQFDRLWFSMPQGIRNNHRICIRGRGRCRLRHQRPIGIEVRVL